ncbi:MAG: hypothetical protein LAO08_20125 [Acidobacteriia bacterium]|nr:hypothetical protein [Terriglobia bacterium]
MSYLFRPTPVFNPGPPRGIPLSGAVSGGVMRGWDSSVNWKAYFDSKRAAAQGSPWIVKSGTMGSYLGDMAPDPIDFTSLPLAPVSTDPLLTTINLPDSWFNLNPPIAPAIVPYDPGAVPSPVIVSSGGSILSPVAPGAPSTSSPAGSLTSIINSIASLGVNIAKAATGQPVNLGVPPAAPAAPAAQSSLVAQAQSLQAQATALASTNPQLAAQYTASANALLAQAGVSAPSWFTQSTVIPGLPNWGLLAGGGVLGLILVSVATRGRK